MGKTRWISAGALVVAVTGLALKDHAGAQTMVSRWDMAETSGTTMTDSVAPRLPGTIAPAVTLGGGVYEFRGWAQNVTASGRLTGRIAKDESVVSVPDPQHVLEPGTDDFTVTATLRTRLTSDGTLPDRASGGALPSFNVVQRGKAADPGGFWKMEILGYGSHEGAVRCVVSDGSRTKKAVSRGRVDDGRWHEASCSVTSGRVSVTLDGATTTASGTVGRVAPRKATGDAVTIGKKPGSTDPSDAFSGWLADLTVQRS